MNFLMKRNVHMQNQFSRRNGTSRSGISRKKFCPSKTCYLIQTDFSWQKARAGGIVFFWLQKKFQPFLNDSHEDFKSNAKKIPRNWSWVALLLGLLFLDVHITYKIHTTGSIRTLYSCRIGPLNDLFFKTRHLIIVMFKQESKTTHFLFMKEQNCNNNKDY